MRWWERIQLRQTCPHPEHRRNCIHGDEIRHTGYKRAQCLDCGTYFDELPYWCHAAFAPHFLVEDDEHGGRRGDTSH